MSTLSHTSRSVFPHSRYVITGRKILECSTGRRHVALECVYWVSYAVIVGATPFHGTALSLAIPSFDSPLLPWSKFLDALKRGFEARDILYRAVRSLKTSCAGYSEGVKVAESQIRFPHNSYHGCEHPSDACMSGACVAMEDLYLVWGEELMLREGSKPYLDQLL